MKKSFFVLSFCLLTVFSWSQSLPLLWESRYSGAGDNSDKFNKIIAVPGGDYVAVGFATRNGRYKDFLTVKISGTNLDTIWTSVKGTGSGDDEAISCAADASGNIYVTGYRDGGNTKDDIYTIKYSAAGSVLWDTAFNSPVDSALLDERPVDCGVDPITGNFVIAGWTEWGTWATNQNDFLILEYDPNGVLLWRTRYNRSGYRDEAAAMAIDAAGDVFVTGRSAVGTDDDWVTMKLDGATGAYLWTPAVKIYSSGNGDDRPADIALDNVGNPVVTGRSKNNSGIDQYRTLKYTSSGVSLLFNNVRGAQGDARPTSLAVNQSNNEVYVTGEADQTLGAIVDYEVMTIKLNSSGIFQWEEDWAGPAQDEDMGKDIVIDSFGNILICGITDSDPDESHTNFDWLALKYNGSGISLYDETYNGSRNDDDEAVSLVSDAAGNAIVAGYINTSNTVHKDAARMIFDPSGNATDTLLYNGEGDFNESSHAMVQDNNGNTFIAGYAYTETDNKNIFAGKIDPSGNLVDTFLFNGSNDDDDELTDIAADANGNIYACGYTKTDGEKSNFMLIRFNNSLDTQWTRTYNYIGQSDKAISLEVDATGIYVTGESDADPSDTTDNDDIFTVKYDGNGNVLWSQRYDNLSKRDQPVKLILGQNNTVYIAGRNTNSHDDDIVLLAYDRTSGNPMTGFPQFWNANFADDDRASDLIEDASGNIYVSGYSQSGSSFIEDYTLLKYDATGNLLWAYVTDVAGQEDRGNALALDGSGNVVIAGQTDVDQSLATNYNYGTFIYDPAGNYFCPSLPFTYNGAGDGDDVPVAVNVNGNEVLVTGQSAEGIPTARNKNIMVRFINLGTCSDMQDYAEYDGPAGGDDAPNATILVAPSLFITGSSDGADMQKDILTLKYDLATGLEDKVIKNNSAMVFPNPLHSQSTLSLDNGSGNVAVKIYNVLGEVVYSAEHADSKITLDKSDFNDGVYSFQVLDAGQVIGTGRFVAN